MLLNLFALFAVSLASTKIFVLFGPSQVGKSSFINALSRQPGLAREGDGSGISQTTVCQEYVFVRDGQKIAILDVPGLDDNIINNSDEAIMDEIRRKVTGYITVMALETGVGRRTIDGIILFESLFGDSTNLQRTILSASMLFGSDFGRSSMAVFTMGDLEFSRRPEACPVGIQGCCEWQSYRTSEQQKNANWDRMKAILWNLDPYPIAHMEQILEEIRVLAQNQCDGQERKYKTVKVPKTKLVTRVVGTGEYGQRQVMRQPYSLDWWLTMMELRHEHGGSIIYDFCTYFNLPDYLRDSVNTVYNQHGVFIDWRARCTGIVTGEASLEIFRGPGFRSKIVQIHTGPKNLNQIPGLNNAVFGCMAPFLKMIRPWPDNERYEITRTVSDQVADGTQDVQVQEPPRPIEEFTEDARQRKLSSIRNSLLQ